MAKVKKAYFCKNCGFEAPKWLGKCPSCGEWNTFTEEIIARESGSVPAVAAGSLPAARPQPVREIRESEHRRIDIGNTEVNRVPDFPNLFERWTAPDMPWSLQYAALMAASRFARPDPAWIGRALETLHRAAERAESADGTCTREQALLIARGAVALLVRIASCNEENRQAVLRAAGSVGDLPAENYLREEFSWQLEI